MNITEKKGFILEDDGIEKEEAESNGHKEVDVFCGYYVSVS